MTDPFLWARADRAGLTTAYSVAEHIAEVTPGYEPEPPLVTAGMKLFAVAMLVGGMFLFGLYVGGM